METKLPNSTFEPDRRLEDQFAHFVKSVLGQVFINKEEIADLEEGTDFAIFSVNPFRVAVRLRRFQYFKSFYDQFTIRWSRPSGAKTEIHKINEGLVDYLFYGFLNPDETEIIQYFIADLRKFGKQQPLEIRKNNPPDSELAIFEMQQFPQDFLISFYCQPSYKQVWKEGELTNLIEKYRKYPC